MGQYFRHREWCSGTVRERQNEVSGGQEAGPVIEKVDGSHLKV